MGEGFAALRARRRLRRGRAHAQVGPAPARRAHRRHRPRGPDDPGRVGQAPGAEPRVQDHEGRERSRSRTASSSSRPRSRCSSTCRTPRTPSPRWRASPAAATCSSASRASRSGAALNMARGAYIKELGNTPGPPEPLVAQGVRRAARPGTERSRRPAPRSRGPCSSSRCEPAPSAPTRLIADARKRELRRRREDPLDRDRVDRRRHLRLLQRRVARAERRRLQADLAAVVGAVRDRVGDLPADRAAALAHDRRPPRARASTPTTRCARRC